MYMYIRIMLESAGMNTYVNACVVLKGEKFVVMIMYFSQVVVVVFVLDLCFDEYLQELLETKFCVHFLYHCLHWWNPFWL